MAEQKQTLASVKASEDKKGLTASDVEGTTEKAEEVKINLPDAQEGKVLMKNITKANVFASNGKMKPGEVLNVLPEDAKLLKEKELCIEVE